MPSCSVLGLSDLNLQRDSWIRFIIIIIFTGADRYNIYVWYFLNLFKEHFFHLLEESKNNVEKLEGQKWKQLLKISKNSFNDRAIDFRNFIALPKFYARKSDVKISWPYVLCFVIFQESFKKWMTRPGS